MMLKGSRSSRRLPGSPGFNNPEGVVVFHIAGNVGFKKTLERDEERKGKGGSQ